jgi:hypothetical protein
MCWPTLTRISFGPDGSIGECLMAPQFFSTRRTTPTRWIFFYDGVRNFASTMDFALRHFVGQRLEDLPRKIAMVIQ